ncbi:regulatory LuxR family protein [Streptomyces sp. HB202]|nr:LuxR C-terminal-related transcriptional regulator [Streptomyces sp. HB202]RDL08428.1 regulatory LuxR family protein [Streptomyces sp. HB202]
MTVPVLPDIRTVPHAPDTAHSVVARSAELAEIGRCTADRMGALLVGTPGVGKSSLLEAALEQAGRAGARIVRGEHLGERIPAAVRRSRGRLVIGIDDVHLAERAVWGAAHRLAHQGEALLIATAETGAALPEGVRRLLAGRRMRRLGVAALDRSGTAGLLAARLGGPVGVDTTERFWGLSGGNALLLRELTDHARAEGTLRRTDGTWHWPGLSGPPGDGPADLVDLLLSDLTPEERELAGMLALAGTLEAGLDVVARLGEAAESLQRRGILTAETSGYRLSLRLDPPLYGAVLAARLPELTARRLRLRIAEAIGATGARRPHDAVRIVRVTAGTGRQPDAELRAAAATGALHAEDFALAESLCASLSRSAVPGPAAHEAVMMLGAALAGQRRYIEAEACFARPAQRGEVVRRRALNLALGLGRPAEAEAVAGADRGVRALVRLFKDRVPEALRLAERAAAETGGAGDSGDTRPLLALLRYVSGDGRGALAVLPRPSSSRSGDSGSRNGDSGVDAAFLGGWITRATSGPTAVGPAVDRLRADGGPRALAHADLLEAQLLRETGRQTRAAALSRRAAAYHGPADWLTTRAWRIALLAGAVAESDDAREAASLLREARAAERAEPGHPLMADAVALEAARVTACLGDRAGAAREALETAGRALRAGRRSQGLTALHMAARAGAAGRALALWRTHASPETVCAPVDVVRLRHIRALARRDGSALDDVSHAYEELGLLPLAAEASAQAAGAHRSADGPRAARAARGRGEALAARCETGVPAWAAPPWDEPRTHHELTAREQEVASLAGARLSNQEIADRLVLSVRTVENHLYRAYAKLGVTSRAELAVRPVAGAGRTG